MIALRLSREVRGDLSERGRQLPKFTAMRPAEVLIGRARSAGEERKAYGEALRGSDAGKLELTRGESSSRVKRLLGEAAKENGTKIRSSWEDKSQRVLLWKKVGR